MGRKRKRDTEHDKRERNSLITQRVEVQERGWNAPESPAATTTFHYRALNPSEEEFRLLELLPGTGDDPIKCFCRYAKLGDHPEYNTISYCWGDETQRAVIEVDGKHLSVPMSSDMALRKMRLPNNIRILWIDAVCIDQANTVERGHQVGFMRKIYGRSQGNLIYLGEDPNAEETLDSFFAIYDDAARETDDFKKLESALQVRGTFASGRRVPPPLSRSDVENLKRFFGCSWFRRVWVMQEAILAPSNMCFYGDLGLDLRKVARVATWIGHSPEIYGRLNVTGQVEIMHRLRYYIDRGPCDMPEYDLRGGTTVFNALDFARALDASDPRDRVFAMLSNMECCMSGSGIPQMLSVDYGKSSTAVLRDATLFSIYECDGSIDCVLQWVSHHSQGEIEDLSWPSWLPKWNRSWQHETDPYTLEVDSIDAHSLTRGFELAGTPEDYDTALRVGGMVVDTIAAHTRACGYECFNSENDEGAVKVLDWIQQSERMLSGANLGRYATGTLRMAFVKVIFCTASTKGLLGHDACMEHFGELVDFLENERRQPPHTSELIRTSGLEKWVAYLWTALGTTIRWRCFFTTISGWAAIGPQMLKKGDKIVHLSGSRGLHVLRPHGTQFRLVGECYVHGITAEILNTMDLDGTERARGFEII